MPDLIESARAILVSSEARVRASAQDIANSSTPAYKQQIVFTEMLGRNDGPSEAVPTERSIAQLAQGALKHTARELDLALLGPGLLQLRDGETVVYSRGGSFVRGADGVLADAQGRVLQQAGGGDLVAGGDELEILADGTVLTDGLPVGIIGLFETAGASRIEALGGSLFRAAPGTMTEAAGSSVRQGFLERANVVLSDELVSLMTAARQAESGARIAQVYDQLIGQAITTFGGGAR